MAIAEYATGTESVGTTEWSMTTDTGGPDADTTDGVFMAIVDLNAMAAGDVFEFKCYEKARSGDTQRLLYSARFANAQSSMFVSPPLLLMHGWDMTLKKISGTDRTINWSIRQMS